MDTPVVFDLLPQPARRSVHHYMTVDGCRPGYAEELLFIAREIPASELKARCWDAPDNDMRDDHLDWDAYHESYWKGEDPVEYAGHLAGMWPVILCEREGIADGWHRLHWYLRNGVEMIPTIDLVEIASREEPAPTRRRLRNAK